MVPHPSLVVREALPLVGTSASTVLPSFRRRQTRTSTWSTTGERWLASVIDDHGEFNGTCTSQQAAFPPMARVGECVSYYPDVTTFCCGAVGGTLIVENQNSANDTDGDGNKEQSTETKPACQSSSYNDMLLCYRYTAEEHCRSAITGPWGVCNPGSASTSQSDTEGSSNSSASQGIRYSQKLLLMATLLLLVSSIVVQF